MQAHPMRCKFRPAGNANVVESSYVGVDGANRDELAARFTPRSSPFTGKSVPVVCEDDRHPTGSPRVSPIGIDLKGARLELAFNPPTLAVNANDGRPFLLQLDRTSRERLTGGSDGPVAGRVDGALCLSAGTDGH